MKNTITALWVSVGLLAIITIAFLMRHRILRYPDRQISRLDRMDDAKLQSAWDEANNYNNSANSYLKTGEYEEAKKMYRKSICLLESINDEIHAATGYNNLAGVYYAQGQLKQAESMYRNALAIHEKLDLRREMAQDYVWLATIYMDKNNLDKSEKLVYKGIEYSEQVGANAVMADGYGNLASVCLMRGQLIRAEELAHKALALHQILVNEIGVANQHATLGAIAEQRRNWNVAKTHWETARDLYGKNSVQYRVRQMEGWLSELPHKEEK